MANRHQFQQSREERQRRVFSEEFKRKKVREIEQQLTTIAQVSRQYEVREDSVGKWMVKYGQNYIKGVRTIVESQSDTEKIAALKAQVAELQRITLARSRCSWSLKTRSSTWRKKSMAWISKKN
jgi:transposase-like protein